MIGKKLSKVGVVLDSKDLLLIKTALDKGEEIPKHNHPGLSIFFTVVKGAVQVLLNDEEAHRMTPGAVLHFTGDNSISGVAEEDAEVFIYLLKKPTHEK